MKKDPRLKSLAFTYAESLKKAGPNSKQIYKLGEENDAEGNTVSKH